jgi:hypothetical protein
VDRLLDGLPVRSIVARRANGALKPAVLLPTLGEEGAASGVVAGTQQCGLKRVDWEDLPIPCYIAKLRYTVPRVGEAGTGGLTFVP